MSFAISLSLCSPIPLFEFKFAEVINSIGKMFKIVVIPFYLIKCIVRLHVCFLIKFTLYAYGRCHMYSSLKNTTFQKHDYFLSFTVIFVKCNRIRMIYQTDSFMCVCVCVRSSVYMWVSIQNKHHYFIGL